jgi:dethiobiotin synthetase
MAGTDTGIGKTFVTAGLVRALRAGGRDAVAMKPIASGFEWRDGRRVNDDLLALDAAQPGALAAEDLNQYGFDPAIAPHRAAELAGAQIDAAAILAAFERVAGRHRPVLVEGVGGWSVPLGPALMFADLARALALPVVLVVGVRLGCINHALLSARAIRADGLTLAGWVANRLDPDMAEPEASIAAIDARIGAPRLGELSRDAGLDEFARLARALS